MKIILAEIIRVDKWVQVFVTHEGKKIQFIVQTQNGKVIDAMTKIATAQISYFNNVPKKLREKHFNMMKEFIETNLHLQ